MVQFASPNIEDAPLLSELFSAIGETFEFYGANQPTLIE